MKSRSIDITRTRPDCIFEQNMGLVVSLAKSFKPKSPDELEEYIQLGRIGLWKATQKYKPELAKFSTLAWQYIRWEILRHISDRNNRPYVSIDDCDFVAKQADGSLEEYIPTNVSSVEREVLKLRCEGRHSFSDIGKQLGYSRAWASHTYKVALGKIVHEFNKKETHIND